MKMFIRSNININNSKRLSFIEKIKIDLYADLKTLKERIDKEIQHDCIDLKRVFSIKEDNLDNKEENIDNI